MSVKYPAFINLKFKNVLLVGGGNVAWEKLPNLYSGSANITIISLHTNDLVSNFLKIHPEINFQKRAIEISDLDGRDLIFSATNDKALNQILVNEARKRKIWINSCDDPDNCDFYSSAVFDKGPIRIAISTDGKFAGLGGMIKGHLKNYLDELIPDEHKNEWDEILKFRNDLKSQIPNIETRKAILSDILQNIKEKYLESKPS